jgi:hypothetical protein
MTKENIWRYLPRILSILLFTGTLFAWYTVFNDFQKFYRFEGTIFKVTDCVIPNPVATPCFYGAFAFLGAFIWSFFLMKMVAERKRKHERFMAWFLSGATIFAWSNFTPDLIAFYFGSGGLVRGCSGQLITSPFTTPCFVGSVLFLISLIVGLLIYFKNKEAVSSL